MHPALMIKPSNRGASSLVLSTSVLHETRLEDYRSKISGTQGNHGVVEANDEEGEEEERKTEGYYHPSFIIFSLSCVISCKKKILNINQIRYKSSHIK